MYILIFHILLLIFWFKCFSFLLICYKFKRFSYIYLNNNLCNEVFTYIIYIWTIQINKWDSALDSFGCISLLASLQIFILCIILFLLLFIINFLLNLRIYRIIYCNERSAFLSLMTWNTQWRCQYFCCKFIQASADSWNCKFNCMCKYFSKFFCLDGVCYA